MTIDIDLTIDAVGNFDLTVLGSHLRAEPADCREIGYSLGTPANGPEFDIDRMVCPQMRLSDGRTVTFDGDQQDAVGELLFAMAMSDESLLEQIEQRCLESINSEED